MTPGDDVLVLRPPTSVLEIARTLRDSGHETWCVGGAVRDALLGLEHLDWDLATAATPSQVQRLFRRTVPVGIEFGTVGVLDPSGTMHEVTTFRRDVETDGRHAVVEFGASIDEDLARRDLTINAIAYDPLRHVLRDPFHGRADLNLRVVRAVGDPAHRMREDRLRALRAMRFAARFDFAIDPATWQAIVDSAEHLGRLSPERVKQELEKTMEQVRSPSAAFRRWRDSGAFGVLIPALAAISERTLCAVDRLAVPDMVRRPQRRPLRIAALFSDLTGKQTEQALRALRFSKLDIGWIAALVDRWHVLHDALGTTLRTRPFTSAELRRLAADVGRLRVTGFMRLAAAHWSVLPSHIGPSAPLVRSTYRRLLRTAFRDAIAIGDLAIDGDDLRVAGIPPGPEVGRVLGALVECVIVDPSINTHVQLVELARHMVRKVVPEPGAHRA